MKLLVGADPEVFAVKDGQVVSAYGLVPGTKASPFPVDDGAVQVDGMALEFNINPAESESDFSCKIDSVFQQLRAMAGLELRAQPVAHFSQEYFDAQPPEATERGCDPDYNAWTGEVNDPPSNDAPMWTGAGHLHLGWVEGRRTANHQEMCEQLGRQMDFYLGLPSLVYDPDMERRSLYGRAGAFRPKPYGLEYRVLSNRWVTSEKLRRWAYKNTIASFESMAKGPLDVKYGDIQEVINQSLVSEAVDICKAEGIEIPEVQHVG